MRILKNKIALSAQAKDRQLSVQQEQTLVQESHQIPLEGDRDPQATNENQLQQSPNNLSKEYKKVQKEENNPKRSTLNAKSTKTIVKNYGKAIASFAMNKIAKPYLSPLFKREGIKMKEFVNYISTAKESIEGIDTFRALLLVKPTDNKKEAGYKRIFKDIAEVFIKHFSVNWIFSGKMTNKDAHLKFRFKMLRRVRNPELFTYLK